MRLVFSFCEKDKPIALKVLKWAASLDRTIEFPTLLCFDASTDATEVLDVARDLFLNVETFVYPTPKALPWPRPQNRAFQACVRHIQTLSPKPWFWWEPDLTPLKAGWFRAIAEAHEKGGKAFSGHLVEHMGHMTGCGVYPHDFPIQSVRGMLADKASWDLMMWKDIHRKVNPINHLLQHQYCVDGIVPSFPTAQSLSLLREGAVVFHRCKDGTLVDRLMEEKNGTPRITFFQTVKRAVTGVSENVGVMAYLPPPGFGNSDVFLKHITECPPKHQLVLLSDHPWPQSVQIPDPLKVCTSKNDIASFVFLHALNMAERSNWTHFIWLETDCRVGSEGWDRRVMAQWKGAADGVIGGGNLAMFGAVRGTPVDAQLKALEQKYPVGNASRGPFSRTTILLHGHGKLGAILAPFVNGAPAVYAVKALRELIGEGTVTDLLKKLPIQDLSLGHLTVAKYGANRCLSKWWHMPGLMATAGEQIYPIKTRMSLLKSGEVDIVHPIKGRWRPAPVDGYSFHCSGNFGDLIYALKAIKTIGGGELIISPDSKSSIPPKHPITRQMFDMFYPLLKSIPWLGSVTFSDKWVGASYDLDDFFELWLTRRKLKLSIENLAEMYCYAIGVHQLFDPSPWLECGSKPIAKVVIHRSARYQEDGFPWGAIMKRVAGQALFIGLPDEWQAFTAKYGPVPFYGCGDFMDMAAVINGAEWFVGNQSLPCAIALALGKNVYQETFSGSPDCVFDRGNFFNNKSPLGVIRWM